MGVAGADIAIPSVAWALPIGVPMFDPHAVAKPKSNPMFSV